MNEKDQRQEIAIQLKSISGSLDQLSTLKSVEFFHDPESVRMLHNEYAGFLTEQQNAYQALLESSDKLRAHNKTSGPALFMLQKTHQELMELKSDAEAKASEFVTRNKLICKLYHLLYD